MDEIKPIKKFIIKKQQRKKIDNFLSDKKKNLKKIKKNI